MFRHLAVAVTALVVVSSVRAAEPTPAEAFAALQKEWEGKRNEYLKARDAPTTNGDLPAASPKWPDDVEFATRYLKLADAHPNTDEELAALMWAALCAPKSEAGKTAAERLPKRIETVKTLAPLRRALTGCVYTDQGAERALAPVVFAKAKALPDDPDAAFILAWVCAAHQRDTAAKPPAVLIAAADLIADKYADSKDITAFCTNFCCLGPPPYAAEFERHLKEIIKWNKTPKVNESARYGLASIALAGGEKRQQEAGKLFREFVTEFETKKNRSKICDTLLEQAKESADRIERVGVGLRAPKIEGDDLDGKSVALTDHKGKVVVLVFWMSLSESCWSDVSQEKELAERFKDRPVVFLGVNWDKDKDSAQKATKKASIPWRSIWDGEKGTDRPCGKAWCVDGWPAVFVIDHEGMIRHNTLRGKGLDEPLEALVKAAEKAVEEKK